MRLVSAGIAVLCLAGALCARAATEASPSCPMQKGRGVAYQSVSSKDYLEVTIGSGPCHAATLTIVIRSDTGQILYSYVAPYKQHTPGDWQSAEVGKEAGWFVDGLIKDGVGSTSELPPWAPPEKYEQEHSSAIIVSREEYEALRAKPRPLFSHATYHEGWKMVVFDPKAGESIVVVEGGT